MEVYMKKKFLSKLIAFLLVITLAASFTANAQPETAYAASAALSTTWKTLIMGNTYTFTVKNATNVKTKAWSSSKPKVATVNGKGKVTPVAAGKTVISCKIVYTDGTTATLKATVAVKNRIMATAVTLNSKLNEYNMHEIKVGETYQFVKSATPSDTTDYAYFTISDTSIASVTSKGIVTALKPGATVLEARCGMNATDAKRADNTATTKVIIYVTAADVTTTPTPTPTPTSSAEPSVTGVTLNSSKEIEIEFSEKILESSVIDSNGDLISGSVIVTALSGASNYYTLAPTLSDDEKSLILTAAGSFEGTYLIATTESILTEDSKTVKSYTVQKYLEDKTGPYYTGSTIDDTGYIATINFNEQIDISGMSIYNISGTTDSTLKADLMNTSNYTLSADRKSLSIDLSGSGVTSVSANVQFLGIKDIAGNTSKTTLLTTNVQIDATVKPLATISNIKRVSKSLVTVTFNRPMQDGGYMIINSDYITGVVDSTDSKKVNFTLTDTTITGTKTVEFSDWKNYNAASYQTTAVKKSVNFTLDTTAPVISNYVISSVTENSIPVTKLTLTYNKAVTLLNGSGSLVVKVVSTNSNITNETMKYTAVARGKIVTLSFQNQGIESGKYTFTIPASFVIDEYENESLVATVETSKTTDSASALPAPDSITQDSSNPSILYVKFDHKLDLTTAETEAYYTIGTSTHPKSAIVTEQTDSSATVTLTFANGAYSDTKTYPVIIKNIKGYNSTYAAMEDYSSAITLIENKGPVYQGAKLISASDITVTFSEAVTGSVTITVYDGSTVVSNSYAITDETLYISLNASITSSAYIMFTNNKLVDSNGNSAVLTTSKKISVTKSY